MKKIQPVNKKTLYLVFQTNEAENFMRNLSIKGRFLEFANIS